ncbi:hypothetical protein Z043_106142 [Scleropages formosus]|uniref:Uncharacterized protein n=1 Tax=Scleropages formosus TaxID=113540 RepID=A0A0N8K1E1_SCLFO|nr:hypothetical protein Z043_106142 [Scleropages formosus]
MTSLLHIPVSPSTPRSLNGSLPNVEIRNNSLFFKGPVTYDLAGTYVCDATNSIGTRSGQVEVNVTDLQKMENGLQRQRSEISFRFAAGGPQTATPGRLWLAQAFSLTVVKVFGVRRDTSAQQQFGRCSLFAQTLMLSAIFWSDGNDGHYSNTVLLQAMLHYAPLVLAVYRMRTVMPNTSCHRVPGRLQMYIRLKKLTIIMSLGKT